MHIPDGAWLAAQVPHTVQRLSTGLVRGCGDKWPRRKRLHLIAIRDSPDAVPSHKKWHGARPLHHPMHDFP